jgi:hypothetical protein
MRCERSQGLAWLPSFIDDQSEPSPPDAAERFWFEIIAKDVQRATRDQ